MTFDALMVKPQLALFDLSAAPVLHPASRESVPSLSTRSSLSEPKRLHNR
jgi:hypothetical protein